MHERMELMRRRCCVRPLVAALTLLACGVAFTSAFVAPVPIATRRDAPSSQSIQQPQQQQESLTLLEMAKSRKARRQQTKSRPKSFFDAIDDAENGGSSTTSTKKKRTKKKTVTIDGDLASPEDDDEEAPPAKINDPAEAARQARMQDAQERMDQRPDVSTMTIDDESGMELLQQGKNVMDVVTRQAVKLSELGPEYRLAQMFPGVPPPVRERFRLDPRTMTVPDMVQQLREACSVRLDDDGSSGSRRGIPPHPSVANKAIDFVITNRDLLGYKMKRTLGRLTLRHFSRGETAEGLEMQKLWKNYETLENHISAPFRQMLMDAEGRSGPQFGNLEVKSFLNGPLYERTANYLVLKGMVAHWEKKVVDAEIIEKLPPQTKDNLCTTMGEGDPRRYLPDAPILYTMKECTQVCYMAQQMTKAFVETAELFNDLPPEVRFLEYATSIQGGTPMRRYMKEEFCPAEGITPAALREGMRRLLAQLENMQLDPYGDLVNLMERLIGAMAVGSEEEEYKDPYLEYLAGGLDGPGSFATYTFNHEPKSLVRFFDSIIAGTGEMAGGSAPSSSGALGELEGMFNNALSGLDFGGGGAPAAAAPTPVVAATAIKSKGLDGGDDDEEGESYVYKPPQARAAGRPHELGWIDQMEDPNVEPMSLGKMKPGKIIPEKEDQEYSI